MVWAAHSEDRASRHHRGQKKGPRRSDEAGETFPDLRRDQAGLVGALAAQADVCSSTRHLHSPMASAPEPGPGRADAAGGQKIRGDSNHFRQMRSEVQRGPT